MFDRFDICEAYFVYAMLWHGGQFTKDYAIFGRLAKIGFRARPSLCDETDLEENAREIYDALVEKRQGITREMLVAERAGETVGD